MFTVSKSSTIMSETANRISSSLGAPPLGCRVFQSESMKDCRIHRRHRPSIWDWSSPAIQAWRSWHILVVAEDGFSMLDAYTRFLFDFNRPYEFSEEVNQRNEVGTLHPSVPISAVPEKYFKPASNDVSSALLMEFSVLMTNFFGHGLAKIMPERLLVDLHTSGKSVDPAYLDSLEHCLRFSTLPATLEEIVLFK